MRIIKQGSGAPSPAWGDGWIYNYNDGDALVVVVRHDDEYLRVSAPLPEDTVLCLCIGTPNDGDLLSGELYRLGTSVLVRAYEVRP